MTGRLRVATYNLKGLRLDETAARGVVRRIAPDVLGVTEPPRGITGRWRLRRFARAVGLRVVVGGRGARTTALLVRPGADVRHAHARQLPWRPGLTRRGSSSAVVDGVAVQVVHLGLRADERESHLTRVLTDRPDGPWVLVGDLNEQPGRPSWVTLGALGVDAARVAADATGVPPAPTYPAVDPRWRIDVAFVGGGGGSGEDAPDGATAGAVGRMEVEACHVPHGPDVERASDHRPLVVDVRLP